MSALDDLIARVNRDGRDCGYVGLLPKIHFVTLVEEIVALRSRLAAAEGLLGECRDVLDTVCDYELPITLLSRIRAHLDAQEKHDGRLTDAARAALRTPPATLSEP